MATRERDTHVTNNQEKKKKENSNKNGGWLYIIHFDGSNHTRIVNEQYVRDALHRIEEEPLYISLSKLALDHCKDMQLTSSHSTGKNPIIKYLILISCWSLLVQKNRRRTD
jgi:hypothetical protein